MYISVYLVLGADLSVLVLKIMVVFPVPVALLADGRIKMELLLVLRVVAGGDDGIADADGGIHR